MSDGSFSNSNSDASSNNENSNPVVIRRPGGAAKLVPINSTQAARNLLEMTKKKELNSNNNSDGEENLFDKLHKVRENSAARSAPFSVKLSNLLAAGAPGGAKKGGARRKTRRARRHHRKTRRSHHR